ncbi:glutaredoxin 2 [Haemophilus haemoglobinophilus]|nr:glutaredoxin 2 [Canicola haemoglobinophilus]
MKLYVYDHCPFCVRARMIFGLKNLDVEKIVLLNDDEDTPISLVGKKVVPILIKEDGTAMPESLDIVHYIDEHYGEKILSSDIRPEINDWVKQVSQYYNRLTMPRFIVLNLPEYTTQSAVDYFVKKKTESIGEFSENLANTAQYLQQLQQDLATLEPLVLSSETLNGKLSLEDIIVFPILRNLTCVKGLVYPAKIQDYLVNMAEKSKVDLYSDRAI